MWLLTSLCTLTFSLACGHLATITRHHILRAKIVELSLETEIALMFSGHLWWITVTLSMCSLILHLRKRKPDALVVSYFQLVIGGVLSSLIVCGLAESYKIECILKLVRF